jgi:hypothetical protein
LFTNSRTQFSTSRHIFDQIKTIQIHIIIHLKQFTCENYINLNLINDVNLLFTCKTTYLNFFHFFFFFLSFSSSVHFLRAKNEHDHSITNDFRAKKSNHHSRFMRIENEIVEKINLRIKRNESITY